MNEDRLIEIETKLAYQERMISELNTVIIDQQSIIEELLKHVHALNQRVMELSESLALPDGGSEKPPHY